MRCFSARLSYRIQYLLRVRNNEADQLLPIHSIFRILPINSIWISISRNKLMDFLNHWIDDFSLQTKLFKLPVNIPLTLGNPMTIKKLFISTPSLNAPSKFTCCCLSPFSLCCSFLGWILFFWWCQVFLSSLIRNKSVYYKEMFFLPLSLPQTS